MQRATRQRSNDARSPGSVPKGAPPGETPSSWEHAAVAFRGRLVSVARRVLRNRADAEETADEAIARLARSVAAGRGPDDIEAWLVRTALRLAIDAARTRARRRRHLPVVAASDPEAVGRTDEDPRAAAEREELREEVWRRVLELSRMRRQVTVLRDMEGMAFADIARCLGIRESTARAHAWAAREVLRRKLERYRRKRGIASCDE